MKLSNSSWTLVSTAPASIILQNTGNSNILITLQAALPGNEKMPNAEDPGDRIEALQLLPGTIPQRLIGLDTAALNVYGRVYGTARESAQELAFFEGV